jgi:hypothetical protein
MLEQCVVSLYNKGVPVLPLKYNGLGLRSISLWLTLQDNRWKVHNDSCHCKTRIAGPINLALAEGWLALLTRGLATLNINQGIRPLTLTKHFLYFLYTIFSFSLFLNFPPFPLFPLFLLFPFSPFLFSLSLFSFFHLSPFPFSPFPLFPFTPFPFSPLAFSGCHNL